MNHPPRRSAPENRKDPSPRPGSLANPPFRATSAAGGSQTGPSLRWHRQRETDRFGRSGTVYVSACGRWKVSDEGPAPWTLFERREGRGFWFHSEHQTLAAAKRAAR